MLLTFWKKVNIWYERLLLLILVMILLIVSWCIYDSWYVYRHTIDDSLLHYKPGAVTASKDDPPLSEDMIAWLTVEDTDIDYPVMQYSDNIKYLNTDPFGRYSLGGSIFLDSRNDPRFTDDFSLIYGHHMEFGKLFGALDRFLEESYLCQHRNGTLLVGKNGEKRMRLSIFAALQASAAEKAIFDPEKGTVRSYLQTHTDVSPTQLQGRLIAFSTCTGGDNDTRTIVFACLTE